MPSAVDNRVKFVESDTLNALDVTYQGVNITGYTFKLNIGYDDCPLTINGSIVDAPNGAFRFEFGPNDLRRGSYPLEIRIIDPVGKELTITELSVDILRRVKG